MSRVPPKSTNYHIIGKTGNPWLWFFFYISVTILSGSLYWNTLHHGYALDDRRIITENRFTSKGFAGIPDHLTTSYWNGAGLNVGSYRPLAPVSFAIEVGFRGKNPGTSHAVNLVLYVLTGLILLKFLKRFFNRSDPSLPDTIPFIVALLFMAHPIHTEAVANIKSRDTMLELLFLLLSVHFLFRHLENNTGINLAFSVVTFFLALLSKENAIGFVAMVPVILVLYDPRSFGAKLKTFLVYLLPVGLFLLIYIKLSGIRQFSHFIDLDNVLVSDAPATSIWATKFFILGKYLLLLVFPQRLLYDYSYNQVPLTDFSNPAVLFSVLVYLAAIFYLAYIIQRIFSNKHVIPDQQIMSYAIAWFFLGFIVSSNLFVLIGSTMGERFMYTPSLGFIMILVFGMYKAALLIDRCFKFPKVGIYSFYFVCLLLLTGYSLKTIDRNGAWKDDHTICTTDMKYLGNNAKANYFVADMYKDSADQENDPALKKAYYSKAIELKEKAVSIHPGIPGIQQQLGFLYGNTGRYDKAIEHYTSAIQMDPREILSYVQIAKVYGKINRLQDGIRYLEQAEAINPNHAELHLLLGIAYGQRGEYEKAVIYLEKALSGDPANKQIEEYLTFAKKKAGILKK